MKKLATFIDSYETYAAMTAVSKDQYGNDLYAGDFSELNKHDGNKFSGLYRYLGDGNWQTTPFINYEEANAVDEDISQSEVDAIFGV